MASERERRLGKHTLQAHPIHLFRNCYLVAVLWNNKTPISFRLCCDLTRILRTSVFRIPSRQKRVRDVRAYRPSGSGSGIPTSSEVVRDVVVACKKRIGSVR